MWRGWSASITSIARPWPVTPLTSRGASQASRRHQRARFFFFAVFFLAFLLLAFLTVFFLALFFFAVFFFSVVFFVFDFAGRFGPGPAVTLRASPPDGAGPGAGAGVAAAAPL